MKLSYTKAWEAKGATGAMLRTAVYDKLSKPWMKEHRQQLNEMGIMWLVMLVSIFGAYLLGALALPRVAKLDLSYTTPATLFVLLMVAIIVLVLLAYGMGLQLVKEYKTLPSLARYVFEHRDDEVEL